MSDNYDYVMRYDILPSQLKLPVDNWRATPNTQIDELAKSIAAIGLQYPPIVAKNMKNEYIVIDGNRRTYACKLLEKGYEVEINGIPATLKLPKNWSIKLLTKSYEDIGDDDIAKIRYHTTEMHVHFRSQEVYSEIQQEIRNYAMARDLKLNSILHNQTLKNELLDYLTNKYQIEKIKIAGIMKLEADGVRTKPEVKEALYKEEIGKELANSISVGIPTDQIKDVIAVVTKYKEENGLTNTDILNRMGVIKAEARENNIPVAIVAENKLKNTKKIMKLYIEVTVNDHKQLEQIRNKQKTTYTKLLLPMIKKQFNLK